jgi:hypothetical protein
MLKFNKKMDFYNEKTLGDLPFVSGLYQIIALVIVSTTARISQMSKRVAATNICKTVPPHL